MGYFRWAASSPQAPPWLQGAESAGRFRPRQRQRAVPQVMERDQLTGYERLGGNSEGAPRLSREGDLTTSSTAVATTNLSLSHKRSDGETSSTSAGAALRCCCVILGTEAD
jgi:hypothetical protein